MKDLCLFGLLVASHTTHSKDPVNLMAAVYDALEEFIIQLAEEDPHFVIFPHNLSEYNSMDDLLPLIETPEDLSADINNWLTYFPHQNHKSWAAIPIPHSLLV